MLILIGFKLSRVLLATLHYVCEVCGVNAAHDVVKQTRRLTIFFVPVLPVGTKYLDICSSCGRTVPLSRQQAASAPTQGTVPSRPPEGPQDTPGWTSQDN